MRQTAFFAVVAALSLLSGPPPASAETAKVLYLTQSAAFAHPVLPHSEAVFTRIAKETGQLEVTVSRDASTLTAETLADYDAVVFFTTGELPMDDAQKAALLAWVRGGGAFVGVHSATDTFYEWPGYLALIGGYFDGHPWHQEVTVRVENPEHPATRHLGESFRIHDEIYQHREWSRGKVDVLLSLETGSVDMNARNIRRDDGDFALAWTREEGDGRVFYTALGHRPEVWDDARFQTHLLQGIAWAIGAPATGADEAADNTAPAADEPGADEPGANALTDEERADGWELLFDGESLAAWRGYRRDGVPDGWQAVDGAMARVGRGGDIITVEQFADFDLRFDWRVEEGGNSGVMFRVAEGDGPHVAHRARVPDPAQRRPPRRAGPHHLGRQQLRRPPAGPRRHPARRRVEQRPPRRPRRPRRALDERREAARLRARQPRLAGTHDGQQVRVDSPLRPRAPRAHRHPGPRRPRRLPQRQDPPTRRELTMGIAPTLGRGRCAAMSGSPAREHRTTSLPWAKA